MKRSQLTRLAIRNIKGEIKCLFSLIIIAAFSCNKPEQPPLTGKEQGFLRAMEFKFNAKARREIDVMMLGPFYRKGKRGGYWVNLQLSCDSLLRFDTRKNSKLLDTMAGNLFYGVLDSDRKYNLITIAFSCDTSIATYQSKIFDYKVDSLRRY